MFFRRMPQNQGYIVFCVSLPGLEEIRAHGAKHGAIKATMVSVREQLDVIHQAFVVPHIPHAQGDVGYERKLAISRDK
jgi:hypothetical protein